MLKLLGVEPVIGNSFTMSFDVDGTETTETFTLCGYWEYDMAVVANNVVIQYCDDISVSRRLHMGYAEPADTFPVCYSHTNLP